MPDYKEALQVAGADVLAYKTFGSYQGDWWAKVRYNGQVRYVHGYYGSCSGCDRIASALDSHNSGDDYHWSTDLDFLEENRGTCEGCKIAYNKLKDIGEDYLENDSYLTLEEAIDKASEHLDWDLDAQSMVDWLKGLKNKKFLGEMK